MKKANIPSYLNNWLATQKPQWVLDWAYAHLNNDAEALAQHDAYARKVSFSHALTEALKAAQYDVEVSRQELSETRQRILNSNNPEDVSALLIANDKVTAAVQRHSSMINRQGGGVSDHLAGVFKIRDDVHESLRLGVIERRDKVGRWATGLIEQNHALATLKQPIEPLPWPLTDDLISNGLEGWRDPDTRQAEAIDHQRFLDQENQDGRLKMIFVNETNPHKARAKQLLNQEAALGL